MEKFIYKKIPGITALSASINEFSYKKHSHYEYAVGTTLHGIQHYQLNGSTHLSHESGIMLFNPEQAHDGRAHDHQTGLAYVMLYIDPEVMMEAVQEKEFVLFDTPLLYNRDLQRKILSLSGAILREEDEAFCNELLLSLADDLVQKSFLKSRPLEAGMLRKAKEILVSNLEGSLKLEDVSVELGISTFQFIRLFKNQTGISPYQYFLNSKVECAKRLIEESGDIYCAIEQYKFVDLTHLNRHFKKVYGVTAFEYRDHVQRR